jgi:hypothetical protein
MDNRKVGNSYTSAMRRLHVTLIVFTLLGLIASMALAIALIKSSWKGNGIGYETYRHLTPDTAQRYICEAQIISGFLIVGLDRTEIPRPTNAINWRWDAHGFYIWSPQPRYSYINWQQRSSVWNHLGFFHFTDSGHNRSTFSRIVLPGWFLMLMALGVCGPVLLLSLRARKSSMRRAAGQCQRCGYDLRESPTRCPECGTVVTAIASAS